MRPSLYVAVPNRGYLHPACANSIFKLLDASHKSGAFDDLEFDVGDIQLWQGDIVRARNRFARHFLNETAHSHILFIDDDTEFLPGCIAGMMRAKKAFVAAPYPRREGIDWDEAIKAAGEGIHPEAWAYRYSVRPINAELHLEPDATAIVEAMPFGCVLLEREGLATFSADCGAYTDILPSGKRILTPNLFGMLIAENDDDTCGLLSEDYSFCNRWRARGNEVYMYIGHGSPVTHHGHHAYRGHPERFGVTHEKAAAE